MSKSDFLFNAETANYRTGTARQKEEPSAMEALQWLTKEKRIHRPTRLPPSQRRTRIDMLNTNNKEPGNTAEAKHSK